MILALTYPEDTALGAVASDNVRAMRTLGYEVRHEQFVRTMPHVPFARVVYHHWNPQPCDRDAPCVELKYSRTERPSRKFEVIGFSII